MSLSCSFFIFFRCRCSCCGSGVLRGLLYFSRSAGDIEFLCKAKEGSHSMLRDFDRIISYLLSDADAERERGRGTRAEGRLARLIRLAGDLRDLFVEIFMETVRVCLSDGFPRESIGNEGLLTAWGERSIDAGWNGRVLSFPLRD